MFDFNYIISDGQTLTRPFSYFFGCKKGFENMLLDIFWYARSAICDSNFYPPMLVPAADDDFPLLLAVFWDGFSNGLSGIDDNVEQNLVYFSRQTVNVG